MQIRRPRRNMENEVGMNNRRVVVTGYGVVSCVGNNVPDFWDSLVNGRCGLGRITRFDASEYRTQIAGEVKDFDVTKYMTAKEAKRLDLFCQYAIAASDEAMDCATCIGCGACVAACKNGSAMLFVSSKVSQLALLPQGRHEAARLAKAMIAKMDELGFGNCTNTRACEAVCPKSESIANIARLNREFIKAKLND